jgi:hypothetical protein
MHDALSLLSGTRTVRFAGVRSRLPFLSTSHEDDPAEPVADGEPAGKRRSDPPGVDRDEATSKAGGRLAAVRERLPLVSAPDEGAPADRPAESPSAGRFERLRDRLPLISSAELERDVTEAGARADWRDAMVDPIEESSLLTPNRALAAGGSLVGAGGLLSVYALLKRRAERADQEEQTWGVAEGDVTGGRDRGGLVGLAFLVGASAVVRRFRRDDEE